MTINALLANRNTSAVSQLVNALHRARTLHDCGIVTARPTNLGQMRLHQVIRLVKHRCHRALDLEPLDFVSRFLQHILPRGFARVRTFGWLHPAVKVRANRVRALLREKPLLTEAEQQAWNLPREPAAPRPAENTSAPCAAPLCPRCRKVMFLVGEWQGAEVIIYPKRPP